MKNILYVTALSVLSMGLLSGCNTAEGFGKDLGQAGRSIERAANK